LTLARCASWALPMPASADAETPVIVRRVVTKQEKDTVIVRRVVTKQEKDTVIASPEQSDEARKRHSHCEPRAKRRAKQS